MVNEVRRSLRKVAVHNLLAQRASGLIANIRWMTDASCCGKAAQINVLAAFLLIPLTTPPNSIIFLPAKTQYDWGGASSRTVTSKSSAVSGAH